MRPPRDEILLRDMLHHALLALDAVTGREREDLDSDFVLAAALERLIEVIGEAANKISEETKALAPDLPWHEVIGMRNRLVHGYASVDHDIVWDVVTGDLAPLIAEVRQLLSEHRIAP